MCFGYGYRPVNIHPLGAKMLADVAVHYAYGGDMQPQEYACLVFGHQPPERANSGGSNSARIGYGGRPAPDSYIVRVGPNADAHRSVGVHINQARNHQQTGGIFHLSGLPWVDTGLDIGYSVTAEGDIKLPATPGCRIDKIAAS
jgi:hypothetical protein